MRQGLRRGADASGTWHLMTLARASPCRVLHTAVFERFSAVQRRYVALTNGPSGKASNASSTQYSTVRVEAPTSYCQKSRVSLSLMRWGVTDHDRSFCPNFH